MKKAIFVLLAFAVVIIGYVGFYSYLKQGGVKILKDNRKAISKESDFYLHYKVLNKKLLDDYGIDLRVLIDDSITSRDVLAKKELEKMISHPRKLTPNKEAKKFIFVLIDPISKRLIYKSSSLRLPNGIFKSADKSSIKSYVISIEEALLEYEWNYKKN